MVSGFLCLTNCIDVEFNVSLVVSTQRPCRGPCPLPQRKLATEAAWRAPGEARRVMKRAGGGSQSQLGGPQMELGGTQSQLVGLGASLEGLRGGGGTGKKKISSIWWYYRTSSPMGLLPKN